MVLKCYDYVMNLDSQHINTSQSKMFLEYLKLKQQDLNSRTWTQPWWWHPGMCSAHWPSWCPVWAADAAWSASALSWWSIGTRPFVILWQPNTRGPEAHCFGGPNSRGPVEVPLSRTSSTRSNGISRDLWTKVYWFTLEILLVLLWLSSKKCRINKVAGRLPLKGSCTIASVLFVNHIK